MAGLPHHAYAQALCACTKYRVQQRSTSTKSFTRFNIRLDKVFLSRKRSRRAPKHGSADHVDSHAEERREHVQLAARGRHGAQPLRQAAGGRVHGRRVAGEALAGQRRLPCALQAAVQVAAARAAVCSFARPCWCPLASAVLAAGLAARTLS